MHNPFVTTGCYMYIFKNFLLKKYIIKKICSKKYRRFSHFLIHNLHIEYLFYTKEREPTIYLYDRCILVLSIRSACIWKM